MKYAVLALALILAGCASAPSSSSQSPASTTVSSRALPQLDHYHWRIKSATNRNGQPIGTLLAQPKGPLQLDFSHGRIAIKHVCNVMSGTYRVNHGQLHVAPMIHTMMACADNALMQMENAIGKRLRKPARLQLKSGGNMPHMILTTADGDTLTFVGQLADTPQ